MWTRALALGLILLSGVASAQDQDRQCEDELGNTWNLPLEQYQSGMRPQGPCLPVGTWDSIRDQANPGWRQRREDQIDRDLAATGPESKRVIACKRCVQFKECNDVAALHCGDLPFVSDHCDRCQRTGDCKPDRRLGCTQRSTAALIRAYRDSVIATVKAQWRADRRPGARAKVQFRIAPDGGTSDIRVIESSRDAVYDASAIQAVTAAGRLPPPPPGVLEFVIDFHTESDDGPMG